jgi:hypothetical protein
VWSRDSRVPLPSTRKPPSSTGADLS